MPRCRLQSSKQALCRHDAARVIIINDANFAVHQYLFRLRRLHYLATNNCMLPTSHLRKARSTSFSKSKMNTTTI